MFQPADMTRWQGRIDDDIEGPGAKRWHQIVRPLAPSDNRGVALIGFASDAGIVRNRGRAGAAEGPAALRGMLANMPVHRCTSIVDAGDVTCTGDQLETAQQELSQAVADLLARNMLPIALGGGHEIAFGSFGGLAQHLAKHESAPRIGILNLDTHFDLRNAEHGTSGTPFRQIAEDCAARGWPFHYCCLGISEFANTQALFERATTLGVRWMLDEEMQACNLPQVKDTLASFLVDIDHLYFTICLDVLPAAVAPGVSAPSARGVGLEVIEPLIHLIAGSGKLRVADIAELSPCHDIDQRTARVAARLVARIAERARGTA